MRSAYLVKLTCIILPFSAAAAAGCCFYTFSYCCCCCDDEGVSGFRCYHVSLMLHVSNRRRYPSAFVSARFCRLPAACTLSYFCCGGGCCSLISDLNFDERQFFLAAGCCGCRSSCCCYLRTSAYLLLLALKVTDESNYCLQPFLNTQNLNCQTLTFTLTDYGGR